MLSLPALRRLNPQFKPPGVPRINWSHPLANGLVFYGYDAGGTYYDLCRGSTNPINQTTVDTSGGGPGSYALGTGFNYKGTASDTSVQLPISFWPSQIGSALPYSVCLGTFYTGAPTANCLTAANGGANNVGNSSVAWAASSTTQLAFVFNNGGTVLNYNKTIVQNTFQTWGISALTSTTATFFANGLVDQNAVGITSTTFSMVVETARLCFDSVDTVVGGSAGNPVGGINGFIPFFAGWIRQLSNADYWMLHNDPYGHLIYPEDDFQIWVNSISTDVLMAQAWF